MRLAGKTAIVTGGASGFGKGIAEVFHEQGAKVVIADLNEEGAIELAGELGEKALGIKCDVTKLAELQNLVAQCISKFGKIDTVINNAGWSHKNQPMLDVSEEEFDRVFD